METKCKYCGKKAPADASFCPYCGRPLKEKRKSPEKTRLKGAKKGSSEGQKETERKIEIEKGTALLFYAATGILGALGFMGIFFIGAGAAIGVNETYIFLSIYHMALAAALWNWPFQEYQRGNRLESRKLVLYGMVLLAILMILAVSNRYWLTLLFDLAAFLITIFLYYRLGGNSWAL